MKTNITVKPKYLVFISLTLAFILVIVTFMDIYQGQKDIYQTKTEEAVSLLRAVQKASENAYISNQEVEKLIADKLINTSNFISKLEAHKKLSTTELNSISTSTEIDHIFLFSSEKKWEGLNTNTHYSELNITGVLSDEIDSLIAGKYDYFVSTSINDMEDKQHFLVIHKRESGKGFIAVSIEAERLLEFRKKIGIGKLFQKIADEEDIKYVVIQDEEGITTASGGVKELSSIAKDNFLEEILLQKKLATRELSYQNEKILEAVKPFRVGSEILGVIRIGVSLKSVDNLIHRTVLRSVIISAFLLLTGVIIIILITNNQNYSILKKEYQRIQTYTGNILENMSDGVVAVDSKGKINLFNKGAENIFELSAEAILGKKCGDVINSPESLIDKTLLTWEPIDYWEHTITTKNGKGIIIGGSTSIIKNSDGSINTVVAVVRDLTSQRNTEEIHKRQEKLAAMGELAGSVAHEIKNPLNTIGITVQRFEKEFIPTKDKDEYLELVKTMKSEVKRVSEIINQFLKFAKPPKIQMQKTRMKEFIYNVHKSFESQAISNKVKYDYHCEDFEASIDPAQMKQGLVNLIQNAFDAVISGGEIKLESYQQNNNLIIKVMDNGKGMSDDEISKIFNLYFTTKSNGTGLGLSIVNQIITEHNGNVKVHSKINGGTTFTIEIPII
ncbi:MAG: ATP-binding protein [Ignavibacteriales bacterium]|nr:ATP-binding protein [Ignavibacteriales bacterium]